MNKPSYEELENRINSLERVEIESKAIEKKLKHLNSVLYAIRNVYQLVTKEKGFDKLLKGVCNNLIETRGYYNAWIAILDNSGKLVTTAESGLGKDFLPMAKRLKHGELPVCGRKVLCEPDVVIFKNPSSTCSDCPLVKKYSGRGGMSYRLEYDGCIYGFLTVSIPICFIKNKEEQLLFKEVVEDIAFALHNIGIEDSRRLAEEALIEERNKLELKLKHETLLANIAFMLNSTDSFQDIIDELLKTIAVNLGVNKVNLYNIDPKYKKAFQLNSEAVKTGSFHINDVRSLHFSDIPRLIELIKQGENFFSSNLSELDEKERNFFKSKNITSV